MSLPYPQKIRIQRAVLASLTRPARVRRALGDYAPQNPALYNAALSGFLAGAFQTKATTVASPAAYAGIVTQGQGFAETVDGLIPPGSPSTAEVTFLGSLCQSIMADKYSLLVTGTDFTPYAAAIAALFTEASGSFYPGGGGSGATAATVTSASSPYAVKATDAIIVFDASDGLLASATLPNAGLTVGESHSFVWFAWTGASPPPAILGGGNLLMPYSEGVQTSGALEPSTVLTNQGGAVTYVWNGADWILSSEV